MTSTFGENLKKFRKSKNLYQKDLANQLFVKTNTITNWEKGTTEPPISAIIKLCEILGVTANELLGITVSDRDQVEELIKLFEQLNEEGKERILEQAEMFVYSKRYKKSNQNEMVSGEK